MSQTKFQKLVNNKFLFRIYLLKRLPMGFIAGIRVREFSNEKTITTIRYKWLTQNPFRSMYFACQMMAAEMSTGLLMMNAVERSSPRISMLIVKNQASYFKKAIGKISFTCADGKLVEESISKAKQSNEGIIVDLRSIGLDEAGEKVAEFVFTWSIKVKSQPKKI